MHEMLGLSISLRAFTCSPRRSACRSQPPMDLAPVLLL